MVVFLYFQPLSSLRNEHEKIRKNRKSPPDPPIIYFCGSFVMSFLFFFTFSRYLPGEMSMRKYGKIGNSPPPPTPDNLFLR